MTATTTPYTIVFRGEAERVLLDLAAQSGRSVGAVLGEAIALQRLVRAERNAGGRIIVKRRRWFGLRTEWRELILG